MRAPGKACERLLPLHLVLTLTSLWAAGSAVGNESGIRDKKTARTQWNTHLSLTSSIINSVGDLQKLTPLTMMLHIPYLRTQRSWWRKSCGSLRCCRPSCCPTAMNEVITDQPEAVLGALDGLSEYNGCCFTSSQFSCGPGPCRKGFLEIVVPVYRSTKE